MGLLSSTQKGYRPPSPEQQQYGALSPQQQQNGAVQPNGVAQQQQWLRKTEEACAKPVVLTMPVGPHAKHGEDGMSLTRRRQDKRHVFMERSRILGPVLFKAVTCVFVPPVVFSWAITILSFHYHFYYPDITWVVSTLAFLPVGPLACWSAHTQWKLGLDVRWPLSQIFLSVSALAVGMLAGDYNYLVNMHHYYFTHSLKSYANVNPADYSGIQLLDAGRVKFADGTRLKIDMGMSFTMWDTYCVAPIASTGSSSASYDLWAVGKNCCSASNPTFACDGYQNINAKSGLRQSNENERFFFELAVQQAEAEYDITAKHPVFFHWVEDADNSMQKWFNTGFRFWVTSIAFHFCINAFVVFLMLHAFKYPSGGLLEG